MDHFKILKRAFEITWNYRVLWVFGILVALASGGGKNGNGVNYSLSGGDGGGGGGQFPPPGDFPQIDPQVFDGIIALGIALVCFFFLVGILITILRYVAESALIQMVDRHEASGEKLGLREGFRLGWNRSAARIFLIDLLIGLAGMVAFFLLLVIAASPLLVWLTDSQPAQVIGTTAAVGMIVLVIFLGILAAIVLSLLTHFFKRATVLENLGVLDSLRRGTVLVRQRLGDVVVMGLILFGLGIGWTLLMIPVMIFAVLAGLFMGGLPALLIGGLATLFMEGNGPWILAGVIGAPIFLVVVITVGVVLGGLAETFKSSTWTLTYRELLAFESLQGEPLSPLAEGEPGHGEPGLQDGLEKI